MVKDVKRPSAALKLAEQILFPEREPWRQRANTLRVLRALLAGLAGGGIIAAALLR